MPLYFAYGANLDTQAMAARCPRSTPVGPARLMNHRFYIMRDGVASVRRVPSGVVHGLLWHLDLADVPALDVFEDVAGGHYAKLIEPVLKPVGSAQAFLYVGRDQEEGVPRPGYLESVVAAARAIGLPEDYVRSLVAWGHNGVRGPAFDNLSSDRPTGPVKGVTPRFATPHDLT